jgi:hypothetical protein
MKNYLCLEILSILDLILDLNNFKTQAYMAKIYINSLANTIPLKRIAISEFKFSYKVTLNTDCKCIVVIVQQLNNGSKVTYFPEIIENTHRFILEYKKDSIYYLSISYDPNFVTHLPSKTTLNLDYTKSIFSDKFLSHYALMKEINTYEKDFFDFSVIFFNL